MCKAYTVSIYDRLSKKHITMSDLKRLAKYDVKLVTEEVTTPASQDLKIYHNFTNKEYTLNEFLASVETDKLIVELTSYLVTLDIETLDNILAWALSESIEEAKKESKYWYKDVKGMCVTADFVKVVLSKITRMTWENSNKALWRNIYKGKLEVKHGMVLFNNGSCYGARYGANESYYCIYK